MINRILSWVLVFAIVLAFFAFLGVALYVGLIVFVGFLFYGLFISLKNEIKWWGKKKTPNRKKAQDIEVEWYDPDADDIKNKKYKAIEMGEVIIIEEDKK